MDLLLNDSQKMIQQQAREFADKVVKPKAREIDRTEEFPWDTIKQMGPLGYMGMTVPEEWGGPGSDYFSYVLALEQISKACASTGVIMAVHNSVALFPIYKFGTEEQKKDYVIPLAKGEKLGAFAMTEANAGSDASQLTTTAVDEGDHYVMSGSKLFITSGCEADVIVVVARTDPDAGTRGMTAFIIEKGMEGLSYGKVENKMGVRPTATTELIFDSVKVPKENVLGDVGKGFSAALSTLDGGRIGIAAQALGIAQAALDEAVEYAKTREQFGKPIGRFQGVSFMIADMATNVEAARWLVYSAAIKKAQGTPLTKEAAMAKLFASRVAKEVSIDAVQIFGGAGYTDAYIVERLMRDARITEIYEGTSEIQKMVIGKQMLK